ncbi:MAG: putative 4-hydroxybenzoate polyprenyltransferase [Planctomycetaceae bacterium]|nr:putative 4-hydroxybenzoate polyprenyltransferase [Planctomycetaceae bacterium]
MTTEIRAPKSEARKAQEGQVGLRGSGLGLLASSVVRLLELIRFSHTLFALPFALLAAAMAFSANLRAQPPVPLRWLDLLGILVCMAAARSAAMAFNRLADRRFDALNPRTKMRHLATGVLSIGSVTLFTVVCGLAFVGGTLLFLPRNPIPLYASLPVLLFLFGYSYSKRFTVLSHFWLGAALMLAPLAAWVAVSGNLAAAPVVLGAAVMLWVAGFDIIYACQDFDFDRQMRLRSVPARLGVGGALRVAATCHMATVVLLLLLPVVYDGFGRIYWAGVAAIGVLLFYEHWIVRPDDLSRVNRAFFHVNAVVSVGLLVIGVLDLMLY